MQLVVLPDSPGVLRPVRLQESIEVATLLLGLPCGELGVAQALGRVDQVAVTQRADVSEPQLVYKDGAERRLHGTPEVSPEQLLHQRQRLYPQRLSVAQLVQTLPQVDELPLGAVVHGGGAALTLTAR